MFEFADKYRGSYNDSIGYGACPFYCDFSGYMVTSSVFFFLFMFSYFVNTNYINNELLRSMFVMLLLVN